MQYTTNLRKVNSAENITLLLDTEILILLNNYKNNVLSNVLWIVLIFCKIYSEQEFQNIVFCNGKNNAVQASSRGKLKCGTERIKTMVKAMFLTLFISGLKTLLLKEYVKMVMKMMNSKNNLRLKDLLHYELLTIIMTMF